MTDPYHPKLDGFVFDEAETAAITEAMTTASPWSWKPPQEHKVAFISVKAKIRDFHAQRQSQKCCYCRVNLQGRGRYMIDREHILPKGKEAYRPYCFVPWNLSISCKRCNMEIKGHKDDFVVDQSDAGLFGHSANYRIVHPNFDRWVDHLDMLEEHNPRHSLVIYAVQPGSDKGEFTYDYFRLVDLQVDTFDQAQGIPINDDDSEGVLEVRAAARHHFSV